MILITTKQHLTSHIILLICSVKFKVYQGNTCPNRNSKRVKTLMVKTPHLPFGNVFVDNVNLRRDGLLLQIYRNKVNQKKKPLHVWDHIICIIQPPHIQDKHKITSNSYFLIFYNIIIQAQKRLVQHIYVFIMSMQKYHLTGSLPHQLRSIIEADIGQRLRHFIHCWLTRLFAASALWCVVKSKDSSGFSKLGHNCLHIHERKRKGAS